MSDNVNHPSHYTAGNIECIEAIKESMTHRAFMGYCKGNVIKYLWRYENKNNPLEDLKKARWYIEKMIDCTAGERLKEKADIKADIETDIPDGYYYDHGTLVKYLYDGNGGMIKMEDNNDGT